MTPTKLKHYEPHQLDQILSLLNDQSTCLTLKTIMLELSVPRFMARQILEDVARQCGGKGGEYEVVRMVPKTVIDETGTKTISMELVVDKNVGGDEGKGTIFSIAPAAAEAANDVHNNDEEDDEDEVDENGNPITAPSKNGNDDGSASYIQILSAAHEKALADQREKLSEGNEAELFSIFDVMGGGLVEINASAIESYGECILPAPELCDENDEGKRVVIRRVKRGRDIPILPAGSSKVANGTNAGGSKSRLGAKNGQSASSSSASNSAKSGQKQKVTTAAAFFGSAKTTTSNNKKSSQKSSSESNSINNSGKSNAKSSQKDSDDEEEELTTTATTKSKPQKGNADDFVGDVDEDDDFLQEEAARKKRNASAARKAAREQMMDDQAKKRNMGSLKGRRSCVAPEKRRKVADNDHEDDDNKEDSDSGKGNGSDVEMDDSTKEEKVEGAMDAFAKKNVSSAVVSSTKNANDSAASGGPKKRIKKLVEKTTVDKNGYMRTEMVTEWEEVDDDGNDAAAGKATSKKEGSKSSSAKSKSTNGKSGIGKSSMGKKTGVKKQAGLMGFFSKKK